MPKPELKVVGGSESALCSSADSESELKRLFRLEADLERKLANCRRRLDAERIAYSDINNLKVRAGLDTLRRQFGAR